jgi:methyltransferase
MLLIVVLGLVIMQRIVELVVAKRNEKKIRNLGGHEVGGEHYKTIVVMHVSFFLALILEVLGFQKNPISMWETFLFLFICLQVIRVWTMMSLGMYWNTKIMILPGAEPVRAGPYRWIKHPNYLIVIFELALIPLMFQAYITAVIFSLLNLVILLKIRIPMEERGLMEATTYQNDFESKKRFIP